jgi:fatty acid-binding protein DegV
VAAAELGVDVVAIAVALDGEPFDGSADTFYGRMRAGAVATTSQPSPGDFLAAYESAAAEGATSILSLHLDRRVSGVAESAALAAREATLPIRVVALPTISYGVGLCVRAASAVLRGGGGVTDAAADAERIATSLDNVFVARAAPGGRVSGGADWALLRLAGGTAEQISTHEALADAAGAMTRRILSDRPGLVAVGHAGAELEAGADRLAHELVGAGVAVVERYRVTPSVGAHTGPDSFGAFWWPA